MDCMKTLFLIKTLLLLLLFWIHGSYTQHGLRSGHCPRGRLLDSSLMRQFQVNFEVRR